MSNLRCKMSINVKQIRVSQEPCLSQGLCERIQGTKERDDTGTELPCVSSCVEFLHHDVVILSVQFGLNHTLEAPVNLGHLVRT